jgi:hypothetical protein
MSAPTTVEEVHNQWAATVLADLTTNYVDEKWADITIPTGSCFDTLSASIFPVDLDAFTALCIQVSDCSSYFAAEPYVPYAFGLQFTLSEANPCIGTNQMFRWMFT